MRSESSLPFVHTPALFTGQLPPLLSFLDLGDEGEAQGRFRGALPACDAAGSLEGFTSRLLLHGDDGFFDKSSIAPSHFYPDSPLRRHAGGLTLNGGCNDRRDAPDTSTTVVTSANLRKQQLKHHASPSILAPWSGHDDTQAAGIDADYSPLMDFDVEDAAAGWGFATLPAQMPAACCSHRRLTPCSNSAAAIRPHAAAAAAAEHQAVARACRRHSSICSPLTPPLTPPMAAASSMHRLVGGVQRHATKDRSLLAPVPLLTSPPPPRPLLLPPQQQTGASSVAPSTTALAVRTAPLAGIAAAYSPGPSMNTPHATQHVRRTAPTSAGAAAVASPATSPMPAAHAHTAVTTVPRHVVLRKTELCASWLRSGTCVFGPRCDFAHSTDELRPVARPPNWR
ncbi:hypothetical protein HK405_011721, partial [Cladochytrium tenue]